MIQHCQILNSCLNIINFGAIEMVKNITISDEVYRKLKAVKHKGENFSELLDRLAKCQDSRETLTKLR